MEKVSKRLNTEHVKAMTRAMEMVPNFVVVKTSHTVVVKTRGGAEVYRALRMKAFDIWTVSHVADLFSKEG